jgi:hypothetical protein
MGPFYNLTFIMTRKFPALLLSILGLGTTCFAQTDPGSVSSQTRLGRYTAEKTVENMVGSPYIFTDWKVATVKFASGKVYKDMQVKYDQVYDKLLLKGEKGEPMSFVDQVAEFRISSTTGDLLYQNGFKPVAGNTVSTFYQVLFEGNIKLLKKVNKTIIESQNYNSPSVVKNIDEQTHYFLVKNDALTEFKPTKKAILEALKDRADLVNTFMTGTKVNFKDDDSLKSIFAYYNSLL